MTTRRAITDLRAAEYNPRTMPEEEAAQLERSIETFGQLLPLIVNMHSCEDCGDRSNVLVGGHQRLNAMQKLGETEVDIYEVNLHLTEEKAANIALNKQGGQFDGLKLRHLIKDLRDEYPETDLTTSGLTPDEIDNLLAPIELPEDDAFAKVPDSDEPDETQTSFVLTRQQKGRVLKALNHIHQNKPTATAETEEETLGLAAVALAETYGNTEHQEN